MNFKIIVATDEKNGIGKNNTLPWSYPEDLKYFSTKTKGNSGYSNAVIMGRKTYESIGKPLPNRINYVLSKTKQNQDNQDNQNLFFFDNYKSLIKHVNTQKINEIWVIGGEKIYKLFLELDLVSEIYITKIKGNYDCDAFFSLIDHRFILHERWFGNTPELEFMVFKRQ